MIQFIDQYYNINQTTTLRAGINSLPRVHHLLVKLDNTNYSIIN